MVLDMVNGGYLNYRALRRAYFWDALLMAYAQLFITWDEAIAANG